MDWVTLRSKSAELFKNYRYVLLILLIGIFLMLLPESSDEKTLSNEEYPAPTAEESATLEEALSQLLSNMDGAGKVQVLLTEAMGEKILYQTDSTRTQSDSAADLRQETVIVTGQDRSESGLILQTESPVYLGAIVLCQGADSASVRLSIIQAVANATGLSTDRISVLKMK